MTKKDCLKIDSSVFSRPQNDGVFYSGYVRQRGDTATVIDYCHTIKQNGRRPYQLQGMSLFNFP